MRSDEKGTGGPRATATTPAPGVTPEIEACPFCGAPARLVEPDTHSVHWQDVYVECMGDCGAQGQKFNFHAFDTEEPANMILGWAISAWNRRAQPIPGTVGVKHVSVEYDGFSGDVIGSYVTREGKRGVVVQQDGTRVVHVYGEARTQGSQP